MPVTVQDIILDNTSLFIFHCHTVFFENLQLYTALLSMAPFFETDIFYIPVLYLCLMFIRILCFLKFYFDPAVSG